MAAGCELCLAEKKTKWFYEDEHCYVCLCKTCGVPMVVSKKHGMKESKAMRDYMETRLLPFADEFYGKGNWRLRREQRKIKDHWHIHAVKK